MKTRTVRPASSNSRSAKASAWTARTRAGTAPATAASSAFRAGTGAEYRLRLHRQQAFALQLLARELARAAHGFGLFAGLLLGGLFVMAAELHLAENPLALHLLLQRLEGLIDIVVANENLHPASSSIGRIEIFQERGPNKARPSISRARTYQIETGMST